MSLITSGRERRRRDARFVEEALLYVKRLCLLTAASEAGRSSLIHFLFSRPTSSSSHYSWVESDVG
jgi:hypothetical protein